MDHYIKAPLTRADAEKLNCGDRVFLTGVVYTARDAAHKKLCEIADAGGEMPFDCDGAVIYYTGPTPTRPGEVIGSAGPTSSYRMDPYAEKLMKLGVRAMIGKGKRSDLFYAQCRKYKSVYLGAVGGCGALIAQCIRECETIAYPELASEAVRRLYVENMPLTVITDARGNCLFSDRNDTKG